MPLDHGRDGRAAQARGLLRLRDALVRPAGPGGGRIDSVDILRGFMALSVAFYHFNMWHPAFRQGAIGADTLAKLGVYAVEGFFIISGFCFFHLYRPESFARGGLWRFHVKRFLRIGPLYIVAVALGIVLGLKVGPGATPRMLAENLTLTFGLFHPNHALVLGGWSIGVEYVFYLALPLLVWAGARLPGFFLWGTAALVALSVPWTLWWVPTLPLAHQENFHAYVQVGNQAFLFLAGGLVAWLRARIPWRLTTGAFLALWIALAWAFVARNRPVYDHFAIMCGTTRYVFASLCLGLVAVFAFFDVPAWPWRRALVFLGDVSYATYLLHPFAEQAILRLLPETLPPWLPFSLGLILTVALAALVHWTLERPFMALGRRLTARA